MIFAHRCKWLHFIVLPAIACLWCFSALADVKAQSDFQCFNSSSLETRLAAVLTEHQPEGGQPPTVEVSGSVDATSGEQVSVVMLAVTMPDGTMALQREYRLTPQDCASVEDLLAVVLSRFLEDLPAADWLASQKEPTQPEPTQPEASQAPERTRAKPPSLNATNSLAIEYVLSVAANTALLPLERPPGSSTPRPGLDAEALVGAELQTRGHGFALQAVLRSGTKFSLGDGGFRTVATLAELGWKRRGSLRMGTLMRFGAIRLDGSGFDDNFSKWLPWIEAGGQIGYRWQDVELLAHVLASPSVHDVITEDRKNSVVAQRLRLGIRLQWSFGKQIF